MKSRNLLLTALAAASVILGSAGRAQTITFDDINTNGGNVGISNGYAGLDWNNVYAIYSPAYAGFGYGNADVSTPNAAFNGFSSPASFSSATPFTLTSMYLTDGHNQIDNVTITGYDASNNAIDVMNLQVGTTPTLFNFDWAGLSSVGFVSDDQVVFDNVVLNGEAPAAPDAGSTLALLGGGLTLLAAMRRRR